MLALALVVALATSPIVVGVVIVRDDVVVHHHHQTRWSACPPHAVDVGHERPGAEQ